MGALRTLATALTVTALAACSTPASRIRDDQAEFDTFPHAVQEKIRAGQVDVGFTMKQVALALGRPTRRYARKGAATTREVWAYEGGTVGAHMGVGFGMSSGGFDPGLGGGMGMLFDDESPHDRMRVVFDAGKVVIIENRMDP